jgi:hypothetical protein
MILLLHAAGWQPLMEMMPQPQNTLPFTLPLFRCQLPGPLLAEIRHIRPFSAPQTSAPPRWRLKNNRCFGLPSLGTALACKNRF